MNFNKVIPIFAVTVALVACEETTNSSSNQSNTKLFASIDVNPAFEEAPPIATNVSLELLDKPTPDGENIRLVASFSERDRKLIGREFLAIQLEKEKFVLRDDGQGADLVKGDGDFSIFLKEDVAALEKSLEASQKNALANKDQKTFFARSIRKVDQKAIISFNAKNLNLGRKLNIPIDIIKGGGLSPAASIQADKSLMVTATSVVEDPTRTFNPCANTGNPTGPWTFGELMRQMASPNPSSIASDAATVTFIQNWLNTWTVNHTVAGGNAINGDDVPSRSIASIMNAWNTNSVNAGAPPGTLLLKCVPFKLTAIVNRLDLRGNSGYGFSDAGEGRLVFCAMSSTCNPMEFNVIFEYGINKQKCESVQAFAQEWADLSGLALGSPAYNLALNKITDQFTLCGTNPSKPNESSINQIRTNEIALASPWELREFNLNKAGSLFLVDVKMEPAKKYNNKNTSLQTQLLATYVNTNEAAILANNYVVPLQLPTGEDFRGGKAHTNFPPVGNVNVATNNPHHWDGSTAAPHLINNDDARQIFSLNTCSGCHGGETQTSFTHIDPAPFGSPAGLSGFLTGVAGRSVGGIAPVDADGLANNIMTVRDPAGRPSGSPTLRGFNDLERRRLDLIDLLNQPCGKLSALALADRLTFRPLVMTH